MEGATATQRNELGGPAQPSEGSLVRNELEQTISRYRLSCIMVYPWARQETRGAGY